MKKKLASKSAFFNPRVLITLALCASGALLALLAFALYPGGNALAKGQQQNQSAETALAQDSITVLDGALTQETSSAPAVPITPMVEKSGEIDVAAGGQTDGPGG